MTAQPPHRYISMLPADSRTPIRQRSSLLCLLPGDGAQSKRTPERREEKEAAWAVVDEDWDAFPKLPGTHLLWHKASRKKWGLKSKNGPALVLRHGVDNPDLHLIRFSGPGPRVVGIGHPPR